MKTTKIACLFFILFLYNCTMKPTKSKTELQNEVKTTEQNFAKMAQEKGIAEAFNTHAAEDAVLMRNNQLIKGKTEIAEYMKNSSLENITLEWEPDFIEVASSGDLAYTYGNYTLKIHEQDTVKELKGIFHTVWKLQKDGTWKFVWD